MKRTILLSALTILFLFLFLWDYIFTGINIFSIWLYKNEIFVLWIRTLYILFYSIFFITFIFKYIYKLKTNISVLIILLAVISNAIWLIEITKNGWEGLKWIEYHHAAFCFICILFIIWLVLLNKHNGFKCIFLKIICYSIIFISFVIVFIDTFYALFNPFKSIIVLLLIIKFRLNILLENIPIYYITIIMIQIVIILFYNLIIAKIEKNKITKHILLVILLPTIIIPIIALFTSYLVTMLPIIPQKYIDPIHWLKLGTIIFSFIIYECSYIAYLNKLLDGKTAHNRTVYASPQ
jgi:hypothetical protein